MGSRIQEDGGQNSWGFVRVEDQKLMDPSKPELTVDRLPCRESAAQGQVPRKDFPVAGVSHAPGWAV